MSPHIHPLKTKVKKPKTKGTKADSVEKVTVADLLPVLENTDFKLDEQPYSSLFTIYQKEFLDVSVSTGLIHPDSLALAGDGTPVVTASGCMQLCLFLAFIFMFKNNIYLSKFNARVLPA